MKNIRINKLKVFKKLRFIISERKIYLIYKIFNLLIIEGAEHLNKSEKGKTVKLANNSFRIG